ncbi:MAG TPA: ATP synthase F0 subunit B [Gemmatales bacterium]|nr:ATP synthase F0 subunit B [Gemmatales bacterium]
MLRQLRGALLVSLMAFAFVPNVNASDDKHGAKYEAEIKDEHGEGSIKLFDLANPAHADELSRLLAKGQVHSLKNEHVPAIEHMFSLRWDLGLWSIIVFGGLLFILSKTAWPAMLQGLKKREQNIADTIAAAENARNEAEKSRANLAGEMAKANDNIRSMMEEARRDAMAAKDDMINSAKKEIGIERDRLRKEIETARDQALLDMLNQSTQLAAMISAKTIKREIRLEDHKKLFDESLKEMKAAAGKAGNA